MRRIRMFTALFLACVLLLACCPVRGEKCYTTLRDFFSEDPEAEWYLGEGTSAPSDPTKSVMMLYLVTEQRFFVAGVNEDGSGEVTVWNNVDPAHGINALYGICGAWDTLDSVLDKDNGYTMIAGLVESRDAEKGTFIRDKKSAAAFINTVNNTVRKAQQEKQEKEAEEEKETNEAE